jgi:hypothetical protein
VRQGGDRRKGDRRLVGRVMRRRSRRLRRIAKRQLVRLGWRERRVLLVLAPAAARSLADLALPKLVFGVLGKMLEFAEEDEGGCARRRGKNKRAIRGQGTGRRIAERRQDMTIAGGQEGPRKGAKEEAMGRKECWGEDRTGSVFAQWRARVVRGKEKGGGGEDRRGGEGEGLSGNAQSTGSTPRASGWCSRRPSPCRPRVRRHGARARRSP